MKPTIPSVLRFTAGQAAAFLVCACLVGCGGQRQAMVAGKISWNKEPLESGMVNFRPKAGPSNEAFTLPIVAGQYATTTAVAAGDYFVAVQAWKKTGRMVRGQFGRDIDEVVPLLPSRYSGPQTELSAHLSAGKNQLDFAL